MMLLTSFEACSDHKIEGCLEQLLFESNLAVATSRRQLKSLPIHKKIFCFDQSQDIHTYLRRFLIHSNYPMIKKFNTALERMVEAGIVARWQKEFEFEPKRQRNIQQINSISLADLIGAFVICFSFLILAFIVAYAEKIIHKKAHCTNPKSIYKWAGIIIDNGRHFFVFDSENGFTWRANRNNISLQ